MNALLASKLRPHQVPVVERLNKILATEQSAIDKSDTGTGKTYVALAVAESLNEPTLAIVPKISVSNWGNIARDHFGSSISAINYESLRTGRTPYGWWDNNPPPNCDRPSRLRCLHCQCFIEEKTPPCYTRPDGVHCVQVVGQPWKYGKFNFHRAVRFLIFDEVHRCNGLDSCNGEILAAAKRQGIKTLMLSATAACSPLHFRSIGYNLDLFELQSYYAWAARFGCRRVPGAGFKWMVSEERQRAIMQALGESILATRGVRVTTESIPGFPERDITAELYDIDGNIEALYAEMQEARAALARRAAGDKSPDSPLTIQLRAHQEVELLKIPAATELARDYREKGFSIGFFVNYSQTVDELRKRFPNAAVIDGRAQWAKIRDGEIAKYQSNKAREIIVNNQAGGESCSLQDLDGQYPRGGIVFPCFSATRTRQLLGRFHRDGGKSRCFYRFLFAESSSTDRRIHRALRAKLNNLDALNDGDLDPCNLALSV